MVPCHVWLHTPVQLDHGLLSPDVFCFLLPISFTIPPGKYQLVPLPPDRRGPPEGTLLG